MDFEIIGGKLVQQLDLGGLFLRLQREMLSNFLSLSDFFLIQYKTRKRPLNTIENFDTPLPPTHAGEFRFLAGFEIK